MQQEQVDPLEAQQAKAPLGATSQPLGREVLDPHLGGHPELAGVDAGALDPASHLLLVPVRARCVDVAIARGDRVGDRLLRLRGVDLEDADPDRGHLDVPDGLGEGGRHATHE